MNFYEQWKQAINNNNDVSKFYYEFLTYSDDSLKIFNNGNNGELVFTCTLLMNLPIESFIDNIGHEEFYNAKDIFQYSNFDHAIIDICSNLMFSDTPLTFCQLGKLIVHARRDGACIKYGENHSKLAEAFSMVSLSKSKVVMVRITNFGKFSVYLSNLDKIEIIKRLAIRNSFIKTIIYNAKKGNANYMELSQKSLSKSTAIRRKSNVKYVVNLILENSCLINNIVW